MTYWLWLTNRRGSYVHRDSVLPGVVPSHVMELLTVGFAESMGLCHGCTMACRCHVIGPRGLKYCTVLFHDAVQPAWRLEAVA